MPKAASQSGDSDPIDAVFGSYGGKKRFVVSHPDYKKPCRVAAPDEDAAIVAAADFFEARWTKYSFYAYCKVRQE